MSEFDCRRLNELLCDFVNGDLDAALIVELEAHLRRCPGCGTLVATYRLTVTLTRKLPQPRVPNDVMCRLREAFLRAAGEG